MRVTEADLSLAARLADAAGAAIRPYFRAEHGLELKDDASPVTLADRAAEQAIRRILDAERSGDGVVGEEYGEKHGVTGRQWVIDPIDGTRAFIAGRPIFGTLIALIQDGWPLIGVIDQPVTRERWVGAIGQPTLFNGAPARTRACPTLAGASIATTSPHLFDPHQAEHYMTLIETVAAGNLRQGPIYGGDCYNYGCLASGHIDVVIEAGLKLHDFAALIPVVEGAGGRMCDWAGDPLTADSKGEVIAVGDPARVEEIIDTLDCGHGH